MKQLKQPAVQQIRFENYDVARNVGAREMAARRKRPDDNSGERNAGPVSANEKIARLLGLLLVKDIRSKIDQVPLLRAAGFEVSEVADLLGMTEHHVSVAHQTARKKRKAN